MNKKYPKIKRKKIKLMFITNTIAWYSVPKYRILSKTFDIDFILTNKNILKKEYGEELDKDLLYGIKYQTNKNILNLINLLIKKDYDAVIISPIDTIYDIIMAFILLIITKILGKVSIIYSSRWQYNAMGAKKKASRFLGNIIRMVLVKLSDGYICTGVKSKEYFIKIGAKKDKLFVSPHSSYIEEKIKIDIKKKYNIPKNKKIILYFGRIIRRKGLDYLIRAFKKLENSNKNMFLLVAGDGPFRKECEKLSNKLKIKNIKFVGKINHELSGSFFKQSNIFVLPSIFYKSEEAWGRTINEAMIAGKPCITTDVVGAAYDLVVDGKNGYIVKQKDVNALYLALKKIVDDSKVEKKFGKYSKKIIKNFRYDKTAKMMADAIIKIIKNRKSQKR